MEAFTQIIVPIICTAIVASLPVLIRHWLKSSKKMQEPNRKQFNKNKTGRYDNKDKDQSA